MQLKITFFGIILGLTSILFGQVKDDFTDGDFTNDFIWSGDMTNFIVNASDQLELSAPAETDESYLAVANSLMESTTWEFYVEMDFNPSSSNQLFVYLVSDQENLEGDLNGYLVRMGNTDDEISLYRQSGTQMVEIIDGEDDLLDVDPVTVRIKVTRDATGNWELLRGATGGTNYVSEGTVSDVTFTSTDYFGFRCDYTSTRSDKFRMDDVMIYKPLELLSAEVTSASEIVLDFDQWVAADEVTKVSNYTITDQNDAEVSIVSAGKDEADLSKINLAINPLGTGNYNLVINNLQDSIAGLSSELTISFAYTALELTELLTLSATEIQLVFNDDLDQTPTEMVGNYSIDNGIGVPASAVLSSANKVDLTLSADLSEGIDYDLSISGLTNEAGNSSFTGTSNFSFVIPLVIDTVEVLSKNELLVRFNKELDQTSSELSSNYSVNNSIDEAIEATLQADSKSVKVTFDADFQDTDYELSIINVTDENDHVISTTGSKYSFSYLPLVVNSVVQNGDLGILITFNQALGVSAAELVSNYELDEIGEPAIAELTTDTSVVLTFSELYNSVYQFTISNLKNESENAEYDGQENVRIEKSTAYRHLIINEIMADPTPNQGLPEAEFVELYNRSDFSINLQNFLLNDEPLADYTLDAGDYVLLTDDSNASSFGLTNVISIASFDALSNSSDFVVLKDNFGNTIDSLTYFVSWYQDAVKDDGGYTLELIDPIKDCYAPANWIAATAANGGTPGAINSVFNDQDDQAPEVIEIEVEGDRQVTIIFSEALDTATVTATDFVIGDYIVGSFQSNSLTAFQITLTEDLESERYHELVVSAVSDCRGNELTSQTVSFYHDTKPPSFVYLDLVSSTEIALVFSEPLKESIAEDEDNFVISANPTYRATLQDSALNRIQVRFENEFLNESTYEISISGIADTLGNAISSIQQTFTFQSDIDTGYVLTPNILVLKFSNPPTKSSGTRLENYYYDDTEMNPVQVAQDTENDHLCRLAFAENFGENKDLELYISNLETEDGKRLQTPVFTFQYDTRQANLEDIKVKNDSQIVVTWNELMDVLSAIKSADYTLETGEQPKKVESLNSVDFLLTFAAKFETEQVKTLSAKGQKDVAGVEVTTTRKMEFVYDPLPPRIEKVTQMSPTKIAVKYSEPVQFYASTRLNNYSLDGVAPSQVWLQGPDNEQVTLTFGAIPETSDAELIVRGIYDLRGNGTSADTLTINNQNPVIAQVKATNDSTLEVSFSHEMSDETFDAAAYILSGKTLKQVSKKDPFTALMTIEETFENGDSVSISPVTIQGSNRFDLLTDSIGFVFNNYLMQSSIINNRTVRLSFDTEFSDITSGQFQIDGYEVIFAAIDNEETGTIRLTLNDTVPENEPFDLHWSGLADRYDRDIPDYTISIQIDTQHPVLREITSDFFGKINLIFSEPMDEASVTSIGNYALSGIGTPSSVVMLSDTSVVLDFQDQLAEGSEYQLTIQPVSDASSNYSEEIETNFTYAPPALPDYGEIIITEIMADPAPAIGLPEVEYLELFNNSTEEFNLVGLTLNGKTIGSYVLESGAYVLLIDDGNASKFAVKNIIEMDIPSLSNSGMAIGIANIRGVLIDEVTYNAGWYKNTDKDDGGYSLELINPNGACNPSINWIASNSTTGGTPGAQNSVYSIEPDTDRPMIASFETISSDSLNIVFSEAMDSISLVNCQIAGVSIDNRIVSGHLTNELTLNLTASLTQGKLVEIIVSGAQDCSGNEMDAETFEIGFGRAPSFNELLITEIMADPEPVAGLPNSEYLEIYNDSEDLISLKDLKLRDNTSETGLPSVNVKPQEYLLLVPTSSVGYFEITNKTGVSSWPSLNNSGENITISNDDELIFEITYEDDWHSDDDKKDGGFSLEMKDLTNPCGGSLNWGSSEAIEGGTPGFANSNAASIPDNFGPNLMEAYLESQETFILIFDETLSPEVIKSIAVTVDPMLSISKVEFGEDRSILELALSSAPEVNQPYSVIVENVYDCNGNIIRGNQQTFVRHDDVQVGDVVINEVLFNPYSGGVDFVELYNLSDKYFQLQGWEIARFVEEFLDAKIIDQRFTLTPGGFVAITTDTSIVKSQYPHSYNLMEVDALPSMPNDEGTVVLLDSLGNVLDEFSYSEDYHVNLLEDVDGVSLERIDATQPTQDENNWTSASSATGFASPGFANSQTYEVPAATGTVSIEPKVFVPGSTNPSFQSFTTINYELSKTGQFANITVYNQLGQPVVELARGESLNTSGFIRWDGQSASGNRVRMGYYVVVFELYDGSGNQQVLKETVVVGR